jgi:formate dehydrogenase accessory protein FdhE
MSADYGGRIERVRFLKERYPFAAEILAFYELVCVVQNELSQRLRVKSVERLGAGTLRQRIDVDVIVPHVATTCKQLVAASPAVLQTFFEGFLQGSAARWASSLQRYVNSGGTEEAEQESREEMVAKILIEPYAELLTPEIKVVSAGVTGNLCPRCGGRPVVGALRIEGEGGKRFLKCAFCSSEWEFRRIYCAYCGEVNETSLPVFVAEAFPHIRVEACDTCHHCLRTVDLTRDGNAVPAVDDLVAIPLGLWAEEHGYERIHRNLLGT